MTDRLFDIEEIPEVPLFRAPRRASAARGVALDSRFQNDYPADWHRCSTCGGKGKLPPPFSAEQGALARFDPTPCPDCLGMGSWKAMVRLLAGHRCVRCLHPYIPKGDAAMIGAEPSWRDEGWSACDERCTHRGPVDRDGQEIELGPDARTVGEYVFMGYDVFAPWRILTVHHLDGDKANCRWWNLAALCQRCHLEIQAKVVMERIYPHEHSEWFKPYAAGYYAFVYLCATCERPVDKSMRSWGTYAHPVDFGSVPHVCKSGLELTREEAVERMDELLALELAAA